MLVAVCDDEKKIGKLIKGKIQRYCFNRNMEWKLMLFESGEEVLAYDFDQINVLFLDVDMPGCSGMEVAKRIRERNKTMLIIFLTAYSEFVFESFKVEAFRYLIKPLKDREMTETLDAVAEKLIDSDDYFRFRFQNELFSVRYRDIIYIEGIQDKLWIYCQNQTYRWRGRMKNLDMLLNRKGFFLVHRSYIINMSKIERYNSKAVFLEGDHKVPISRYRWEAFKEEYIRFWSKVL